MKQRLMAYFGLAVLAVPHAAYADAGVPMIVFTLPAMVIALIPVILLESAILTRRLPLTLVQSLKPTLVGNVISTVLGIPLTWFALFVVQGVTGGERAYGTQTLMRKFLAVTWQAPWLLSYDSELHWMIPAAALVLLVPFFFASWWIEYQIEKRMLRHMDAGLLKKAIRDGNMASYALLASVAFVVLIRQLVHGLA